MKKNKEIGLDFIGGQGSLTLEEEKALSSYLQQKKLGKKSTVYSKRNNRKTKKKLATV
ncbi:MAG: hypothetical protein IPI46_12060 [Bacteroidetes bacterium]|nr:hypothetical protein [Bacteroidota bacterium]